MNRWNAKQKELALIIGRMSGIESASVLFDEEIKRGLTQQKQKTAMVTVQTRSGQLDEDQVKAIRNVVASSYAGLDRHNITITDLNGATYGGAIGPDGVPEDESVYASHKLRYEREFQRKIQQQLAYIPGVIIGVNAELSKKGWTVVDGSAGGVEEAAAAGTLSLWLSGSKAVFDEHQAVFKAMGNKVLYVGELGNAKLVKNAMAMFAAVTHLTLAEICSWLKKGGLTEDTGPEETLAE